MVNGVRSKCSKPTESAKYATGRYCEKDQGKDESCGCHETCEIIGDPHISPFFTNCSVVSMNKVGEYVVWGMDIDDTSKFNITVVIEKRKTKYKFIHVVKINNEVVMNTRRCNRDINDNEVGQRVLGDKSVIRWKIYCDQRHERHLNMKIDIADDNKTPKLPYHNDTVPASTPSFKRDYGICVDPKKYNHVIDEPNYDEGVDYGEHPFWMPDSPECVRIHDTSNGRVCDICDEQCGVYGDPWVIDFYKPMPENGQATDISFKLPEDLSNPMSWHELYSAPPRFGVFIEQNECQYITKVYVVYQKEECNNTTNEECYYTAIYDPSVVCKTYDKNARTTIIAPSPVQNVTDEISAINNKVYDASVDGFKLGMYAPYNINAGSVRTILKCHKTKAHEAYFNVCVERTITSGLSFEHVEKSIKTGGWCAIGKLLKNKRDHQYRKENEIGALAYNPLS